MQYIITPFCKAPPSYVCWENAFNLEELNWLQHQAKSAIEDAVVGGANNNQELDKNIRRSRVSWLGHTSETNWLFEKLSYVCSHINIDSFRFDLTGFGEKLQLTNYSQSENGMYGWHQDFGGNVSRKLSLIIQLSDASEYEGGNLQIMINGEPVTVSKQRGCVIALPSYILHQVTPVTQGSRQSLVAWVSGPAFR